MKTFLYTLCDALYKPWLPHWIYYHKSRFDVLYVLLRDDNAECVEICRDNGVNILIPEASRSSWCVDHYGQIWDHAHSQTKWYGFNAWYSVIDIDEIFDIRYHPKDIIADCMSAGNIYIWAQMLNRFNLNYGESDLPIESKDLFKRFPFEYPFHGLVRKANDWKPVLRRCDMRGLHSIEHGPGRKWHDPRQFTLHHFDINAQGFKTCSNKLSILMERGCKLSSEYINLINVLKGNVDLTESDLESILENTEIKYKDSIFLPK